MSGQVLKFRLPVSIFREGDKFIAYTPALDISTSADSFTKVRERFSETVNIFFEEIKEKGTLEQVLEDLGWEKLEKNWSPPTLVAQEAENIEITV